MLTGDGHNWRFDCIPKLVGLVIQIQFLIFLWGEYGYFLDLHILTITLTVKKILIVTVKTTHRILKLKINIEMYIPIIKNCSMTKARHFILKLTSVSQFLNSSGKEFQCYYCSISERSTVQK